MLQVSIPFILALFLLVLLLHGRTTGASAAQQRFLLASLLLTLVVGLRWHVGAAWLLRLQPVCAALLPPVTWHALQERAQRGWGRLLPLLPAGLVAVASWRAPWLIDPALFVIFAGYGAALLWSARRPASERTRQLRGRVGALLLAAAVVDAAVALDFVLARGAHASSIVGQADLLMVFALAFLLSRAARMPAPDSPVATPPAAEPEVISPAQRAADLAIVQAIEALLGEQQLYRDSGLTLDRLARRAGIPARQISAALNRHYQQNVSQVINGYRIAAAQHLLRSSRKPVTDIMLDVGFLTKSNFNREFVRLSGQTPSAYRQAQVAEDLAPSEH